MKEKILQNQRIVQFYHDATIAEKGGFVYLLALTAKNVARNVRTHLSLAEAINLPKKRADKRPTKP